MTTIPPSNRFITLTLGTGEETGVHAFPELVLNPRSVAYIQMLKDDDGGSTIAVTMLTGDQFHIGPFTRVQVRKVYQDLLDGLGHKNAVRIPEGTSIQHVSGR